jgi:hypothetical protein
MPLRWLNGRSVYSCGRYKMQWHSIWVACVVAALVAVSNAMTPKRIAELRQETVSMFYHGFDNYMNIAFPEDEVCYRKESGETILTF